MFKHPAMKSVSRNVRGETWPLCSVTDRFYVLVQTWFLMQRNKKSVNPFCFYNRDHFLRWTLLPRLHRPGLHLAKLHVVATLTLDQLLYNLHPWGRKEPFGGKKGRMRKRALNEEHLVFTGGGTDRGFCGGGEGSYDWGEDYVRALSGVDGRVEASGAVVLHQRDGLPVVGVQTGAQRRFVVVAAADERLTRHLSAERSELIKPTAPQRSDITASSSLKSRRHICLVRDLQLV